MKVCSLQTLYMIEGDMVNVCYKWTELLIILYRMFYYMCKKRIHHTPGAEESPTSCVTVSKEFCLPTCMTSD